MNDAMCFKSIKTDSHILNSRRRAPCISKLCERFHMRNYVAHRME